MCEEILYSQNKTPAEIAIIISWANPDIKISTKHKEMMSLSNQQRQNLARQESSIKKEQIQLKNGTYELEGCYITESESMKAHSKRKQTEAVKEWLSKTFVANQARVGA